MPVIVGQVEMERGAAEFLSFSENQNVWSREECLATPLTGRGARSRGIILASRYGIDPIF
jgi:hypothetical protein